MFIYKTICYIYHTYLYHILCMFFFAGASCVWGPISPLHRLESLRATSSAADEFLQAMPGNTPVRKSIKGYPEQDTGAAELHDVDIIHASMCDIMLLYIV